MRAAIILLILGLFLVGTTVCGPATAVAAATPTVEHTAALCDDRAPLPAAPAAWPHALALNPVGTEVRPDLAGAFAPAAAALTPRSSPARATPLRL